MSFSLVGTRSRSFTSFESLYIGGLWGALDRFVTEPEVAITMVIEILGALFGWGVVVSYQHHRRTREPRLWASSVVKR
ncbi:MAG: hypothetical protein ACP5O0_06515 [Acidimicrobiales bacterium]